MYTDGGKDRRWREIGFLLVEWKILREGDIDR